MDGNRNLSYTVREMNGIYWEENLGMIQTFWFTTLGEEEVWKNAAWKWQKCRGEVEDGDGDRNPVCKYFGKTKKHTHDCRPFYTRWSSSTFSVSKLCSIILYLTVRLGWTLPVGDTHGMSNCNNLRILLVHSHHIDSRVFWGHLRQTYCQHNLHQQTLLLVGSHAASPPFATVFPHLYALLTASLVLGLGSALAQSHEPKIWITSKLNLIISKLNLHVHKTFVDGLWSTPDTLTRSFMRHKFVTHLLTAVYFVK